MKYSHSYSLHLEAVPSLQSYHVTHHDKVCT
jgi:hypothetical protein